MNISGILNIMKNKNIGKEKIVLLALAGILLISASYFEKGSSENSDENVTAYEEKDGEDYQSKTEKKIKELIESIDGISNATVMVNLKSGSEKILQEDSEISSSDNNTGENSDSSGNVKKTTVIFSRDGDEEPYVIKENYPEIEGIAVTAKGVSKGTNMEKIINMISALFDMEVHKISVLEVD